MNSVNRNLLVTHVERLADDVVGITLADPEDLELEKWKPGAHLELTLPSGRIRHYSLIGDPGNLSSYRIAVLKDAQGRGGSKEIHEQLRTGHILDVSAPRNHFPLIDAKNYLFIAGGIGITPILPMIQEVERRDRGSWSLMYGGRSRSSMAFHSDLSRLYAESVDLYPENERGFMPILDALQQADPGTAVYCCGPSGLIDAVVTLADSSGRRKDLHLERFSSGTGRAAPAAGAPFEVRLATTGETISIPAESSILDVIEGLRPEVRFSCREGFCGSCETGVLSGIPDHRDTVLTSDERERNTCMMICVSRSKTPLLVLDL